MVPLTVQLVGELIVYVTLSIQLPDGFGPNEIPPPSIRVRGNAGPVLVKLILPEMVISGSPLKVTLETEQLAGVTMTWVSRDPVPELLSVPAMSPVTEMVPPPGQGALEDNGKLQLWPVELKVHVEDSSGRSSPSAAVKPGVDGSANRGWEADEFERACATACDTCCEIACACAADKVSLWVGLPHPAHSVLAAAKIRKERIFPRNMGASIEKTIAVWCLPRNQRGVYFGAESQICQIIVI